MTANATLVGLVLACALPASVHAGSLAGRALDASTKQPLAKVVVSATAPGLTHEWRTRTEADGSYQFAGLPSGRFTLRFEREDFMPYTYAQLSLPSGHSQRFNVELIPEGDWDCYLVIIRSPPQIDVGSNGLGVNVDQNLLRRVPLLAR